MTGATAPAAVRDWLADRPSRTARLRLFCFPHAGAGATAFQGWAAALSPDVQVLPVRLPGRETRRREPSYRDAGSLTADLARGLAPWWQQPYALFGHSMGALLAFELARELRRRGLPGPRRLIVSGRIAPQLKDPRPRWHGLPDAELLAEIGRLGGMPGPLLLADPELLSVFLSPLRSDIELSESYRYRAEAPLDTPITVLGGASDPKTDTAELYAWRQQSAAGAEVRLIPGGHFFVSEQRAAVLGRIRTVLAPAMA